MTRYECVWVESRLVDTKYWIVVEIIDELSKEAWG